MKKIIAVTALLLVSSSYLYAQEKTPPKPLIIQTMYISTPGDGTLPNVDSLLKIWKERIMNPNPYFVSTKIIQHWWGHDSREVIFIFELKNWNDVEPAFDKRNEIIKEHKGWATKEDVDAFRKLWMAVFARNSHHSDEIYRVVAE